MSTTFEVGQRVITEDPDTILGKPIRGTVTGIACAGFDLPAVLYITDDGRKRWTYTSRLRLESES